MSKTSREREREREREEKEKKAWIKGNILLYRNLLIRKDLRFTSE